MKAFHDNNYNINSKKIIPQYQPQPQQSKGNSAILISISITNIVFCNMNCNINYLRKIPRYQPQYQ